MKKQKIAGLGTVLAALALAFAATAARAETKIVLPADGKEQPKAPPTAPVTATDSGTYDALKARVDSLEDQNGELSKRYSALKSKYDGSKGESGVTTDATASTNTVAGAAAQKPTVPAPGVGRPEPPPIPDQDGDKKDKSFSKNAKKTSGAVGDVVKPIGVSLGAALFLFGVMALFLGPAMAAAAPALMIGGALTACAGVLIGGILQGSSK